MSAVLSSKTGHHGLGRTAVETRTIVAVSLVLFAVPIIVALYHDIHRYYLTTPDGDLNFVYEALRINAGLGPMYWAHPGYLIFLMLSWWFELLELLGLVPISALNQLPPLRSEAFAEVYAELVYSARYFMAIMSGCFAIVFFRFAHALTGSLGSAVVAGSLFATSPALGEHALMVYNELLSSMACVLAFWFLAIAARRDGTAVARPLFLTGACVVLALLEKVQALMTVLALPALTFLVIDRMRPPTRLGSASGVDAQSLVLAVLVASIAAVLAAHVLGLAIISWGKSGFYQGLIAFYVIGAMILYARIHGIDWPVVVLGASALVFGFSVTLIVTLPHQNFGVADVIANPIDHLFNFSIALRQAGAGLSASFDWSRILAYLGDGFLTVALPSFLGLDILERPIRLVNLLVIVGCGWAVARRRYPTAIAAASCLATALALTAGFTTRGVQSNYMIYIDPWSYLAAAILLSRLVFDRPRRTIALAVVSSLASAVVLIQLVRSSDPSMVRVEARDKACGMAVSYAPEIAEGFARYCIPPR